VITVHKSQGLTLPKAFIDLGPKEYASGLSFVAISRVGALKNILFKPFSFDRLQRIQNCKRLQERKEEESRLRYVIFYVKFFFLCEKIIVLHMILYNWFILLVRKSNTLV
jgi:hypothetical protein